MLKTLFVSGTRPEAIQALPRHPAHEVAAGGVRRSRRRHRAASSDARSGARDFSRHAGLRSQFDDPRPGACFFDCAHRCRARASSYLDSDPASFTCRAIRRPRSAARSRHFTHASPWVISKPGCARGSRPAFSRRDESRRYRTARRPFIPPRQKAPGGNLLRENVAPETIHVTGNSGIDALLHVRDRLAAGELTDASRARPANRANARETSDRRHGASSREFRQRLREHLPGTAPGDRASAEMLEHRPIRCTGIPM